MEVAIAKLAGMCAKMSNEVSPSHYGSIMAPYAEQDQKCPKQATHPKWAQIFVASFRDASKTLLGRFLSTEKYISPQTSGKSLLDRLCLASGEGTRSVSEA